MLVLDLSLVFTGKRLGIVSNVTNLLDFELIFIILLSLILEIYRTLENISFDNEAIKRLKIERTIQTFQRK